MSLPRVVPLRIGVAIVLAFGAAAVIAYPAWLFAEKERADIRTSYAVQRIADLMELHEAQHMPPGALRSSILGIKPIPSPDPDPDCSDKSDDRGVR